MVSIFGADIMSSGEKVKLRFYNSFAGKGEGSSGRRRQIVADPGLCGFTMGQ